LTERIKKLFNNLKKFFITEFLVLKFVQYGLSGVFLVAAFSKVIFLESFFFQIKAYKFPISENLIESGSLFLIVLEALTGAAILVSYRLKIFITIAQVFLLFFIPVTLWGVFKQAPSCACYPELVQREPWKATIEDLLFLGVSFYLKNNFRILEEKAKIKAIYKKIFIFFVVLSTFVLFFF